VLLERLIVVLLDNAEQYNVPGGSIAISTGTTDGAAVLRVVNTGPVIPPGQLDRLFLSFTAGRSHPSRGIWPWSRPGFRYHGCARRNGVRGPGSDRWAGRDRPSAATAIRRFQPICSDRGGAGRSQ
jgi:hypothetical protein